jgi:hypothetical protein
VVYHLATLPAVFGGLLVKDWVGPPSIVQPPCSCSTAALLVIAGGRPATPMQAWHWKDAILVRVFRMVALFLASRVPVRHCGGMAPQPGLRALPASRS